MKNPKCPYCGKEMEMRFRHRPDGAIWKGVVDPREIPYDAVVTYVDDNYHYYCRNCKVNTPYRNTPDAAYDAAMKRDRAKGYLAYKAGHHWEEDGTDYPDICVYVNGYCSECGQVMCRAGETTIHYPDELMYTDKDWDYRKELIEAEDKLLEAATQRKVSITNFCPNCGADMREEENDD